MSDGAPGEGWLGPEGPGLSLVRARQRVIRAVLGIQMTSVSGTFAGSLEATAQYGELTAAARELVAAEDRWEEALRECAARHVGGAPV